MHGRSVLHSARERRQAPRIDVFGQLHGHVVDGGLRVVILDISTGGMCLAARDPLEVGSVHQIHVTNRDGLEAEVEVRIVNRREATTPAGTVYHVIGSQLTRESDALNRIIDHFTSALIFDVPMP